VNENLSGKDSAKEINPPVQTTFEFVNDIEVLYRKSEKDYD
jgi:hypothetical protein